MPDRSLQFYPYHVRPTDLEDLSHQPFGPLPPFRHLVLPRPVNQIRTADTVQRSLGAD